MYIILTSSRIDYYLTLDERHARLLSLVDGDIEFARFLTDILNNEKPTDLFKRQNTDPIIGRLMDKFDSMLTSESNILTLSDGELNEFTFKRVYIPDNTPDFVLHYNYDEPYGCDNILYIDSTLYYIEDNSIRRKEQT